MALNQKCPCCGELMEYAANSDFKDVMIEGEPLGEICNACLATLEDAVEKVVKKIRLMWGQS